MSPVFPKPLSELVAMSISNPANCEVRSVIQFLNVKNIRPAEIHCQLAKVYGESVQVVSFVKWGKDRCAQ
jgi:hypothetical protein